MPWAKDSLRIRTRMLDQKVLGATVTGYLTLASSAEMRKRIVERMDETGALAVVLDMRGTVHVMDNEDWQRIIDTRDLAFPMPVPVAMIVSEAEEEKVRAMAAAMSGFGHLRGVFRELPPAVDWARRWAGNWVDLSKAGLS
jgi:hypothetical protein